MSAQNLTLFLSDEAATMALGQRLAAQDLAGFLLTLSGPLGAGKTTLVRALIQALGHEGSIPSPSYGMVQVYEALTPPVYHLDLYRIQQPVELYDIGFEDFMSAQSLVMVEWPEKGAGVLPPADCHIDLDWQDDGRRCVMTAHTERGKQLLTPFATESKS